MGARYNVNPMCNEWKFVYPPLDRNDLGDDVHDACAGDFRVDPRNEAGHAG